MRRSQLFTKTSKTTPGDETARNAQLLIRAGFIHKEMAGVYAYLPLGLIVLENIKAIVRAEMQAVASQELIMTSLQRKELWETTGRWSDEVVDVWFKSELKNGTPVGFGWSHEEQITNMMKSYVNSYRDLPFSVYQFQTKLRNELRSKSGIMRGREFVMKDAYSYSRNAEEHDAIYEAMTQAYLQVFERVGLGDVTYVTAAAGGAFTKYSHEFQTISPAGEDIIYVNRENNIAINEEVYNNAALAELGLSREGLEKATAAEVGNIFSFGTQKSEQLGLYFSDEDGSQKPVVLGSYGIGITRLMGVIAEHFADDKGLVWPVTVAPFQVYLVAFGQDPAVQQRAEALYEVLTSADVGVLYDDRDTARPGEKLADGELMGIPYTVVVGAKTGTDQAEIKARTVSSFTVCSLTEILETVTGNYPNKKGN
jgi:prolyl-tRNA synthetase